MAVNVVIQVRPEDRNIARTQAVEKISGDIGVSFAPVDPTATDGPLAEYFQASVSQQSAASLVESLRRTPGVRAAYIKPSGRPPH